MSTPTVAYMVRTCTRHADGTLRSQHDAAFIWPEAVGAVVTAPDWRPDAACGGGLHGLVPGQQDPGLWAEGPDAVWMVVSFDPAESVDLGGKTKARTVTVEATWDAVDGPAASVTWLKARGILAPGYRGTATAGYRGTATAGYRGTATAGAYGTATAGAYGTATAGEGGTATAGGYGRLTISWYDTRRRVSVAYVGEGGILPNVPYRLDVAGRFVRA